MSSRRLTLVLAALAALLGPAGASTQSTPSTVTVTTFVVTGRGWGHGVGMSQWGAYGYAKRGVTYDRILSHFYPGTKLAPAPVNRLNVLLVEQTRRLVVSSPDAFSVKDGAGTVYQLAAGNYELDSTLALMRDPSAPPQALSGPLTFRPGKSPLWLTHPFRGELTVTATGKSLSVVNSVALESYVRGVVSREMPHDWPLEAVKAQAVATRSYALSHLRGGPFDVYADTRDQVYGGIAAETQVGDQAVAATKRQVLLYDGKVAQTFFFSSSGGRTAAVTDVFAGSKPTPYLVSVPDPYETASPYHTWGPVTVGGASVSVKLGVPGVVDLQPVPASGRARSILVTGRTGEVTVPASDVRRALDLRSTWIRVGVLSLSRPAGPVTAGASVTLTGRIERMDGATLEQRVPGSADWQAGPVFTLQADGTFSVATTVVETIDFRLAAGDVKSAVLRVPVGS
jgi:stage II sporulation protein D